MFSTKRYIKSRVVSIFTLENHGSKSSENHWSKPSGTSNAAMATLREGADENLWNHSEPEAFPPNGLSE